MADNQYEFSKIVKVEEVGSSFDLNKYLDLGWVLLGVFGRYFSKDSFKPVDRNAPIVPVYSIGWPKDLGDVKEPPKKDLSFDNSEPF